MNRLTPAACRAIAALCVVIALVDIVVLVRCPVPFPVGLPLAQAAVACSLVCYWWRAS
jgi:hypothetical protein